MLASWLVEGGLEPFLSGVLLRFRLCQCFSVRLQRMFGDERNEVPVVLSIRET